MPARRQASHLVGVDLGGTKIQAVVDERRAAGGHSPVDAAA